MAICKLVANSLAYQLVHTLASTFVYPLHDEFFIPPAVLAWVRYFRYVGNIFVCWCNFWNRVCIFRWMWRNYRSWFLYGCWKIVYVLFLLEFNLCGCEFQNIIVPEIFLFKIIIRDGTKIFPGDIAMFNTTFIFCIVRRLMNIVTVWSSWMIVSSMSFFNTFFGLYGRCTASNDGPTLVRLRSEKAVDVTFDDCWNNSWRSSVSPQARI